MAALRKRGDRWQVQVRRKGRTPVSCSFKSKSDALKWGREQELEVDQGRPEVHRTLKSISVADIMSRYRDEVVPRKRGAHSETLTLNAFLRHPLARVALRDVTANMVSAYCAERLPANLSWHRSCVRFFFFPTFDGGGQRRTERMVHIAESLSISSFLHQFPLG